MTAHRNGCIGQQASVFWPYLTLRRVRFADAHGGSIQSVSLRDGYQCPASSPVKTPYAKKPKIPSKMMQAHQGLHGIGNNHTNNHQAQFVRLRLPFFSDSIQFTLCAAMRNRILQGFKLTHYRPSRRAFLPLRSPGSGIRSLLSGVLHCRCYRSCRSSAWLSSFHSLSGRLVCPVGRPVTFRAIAF
jgi:hypothetical protein